MQRKYKYLIVVLLIVASVIAYGRVIGNDFINLDDNVYITENSHIKSGFNPENIKWAFTSVVLANWHPVTLLSHTLNWSFFKNNAGFHHLVSLILHIFSMILLFFLLDRMTKSLLYSAFVAAFFALHPLRVESVAWAAELKDVLSIYFGLASIYVYVCYAEKFRSSQYFLCLIFFMLSLMSKPMLVTLPFIFLLVDYWPLGRWQKAMNVSERNRYSSIRCLILEKLPFILLSIVSSIVTIWAQNKYGAIASIAKIAFLKRIENAVISYVVYLKKLFWPFNLAIFYPYENSFPLWEIGVSLLIIVLITIIVIYYIKKIPFLFVGWFWYLGTMIPVIGLIQVGSQALADRYTYFPSIGIGIMLAWGIPFLLKSENIRKNILLPAAITVLIILASLTWRQCGYWENSIKLFNHALRVTKNNYIIHNNRGVTYDNMGQYQQAMSDFNEAIRLKNDYADAYYNRGRTNYNMGNYQKAIEDYDKSIYLNPMNAQAFNNRGVIYGINEQYQLSIEDFNKAILLKQDYVESYNNRGITYTKMGQYQKAIDDYSKVIGLKANDANAYNNRGLIYFMYGNNNLGCLDLQKSCNLGDCKLLELAKNKGKCL